MPASGEGESEFERARIGEVELAWTESGPAPRKDASTGALPLVLVHGFTGSRDDWIGVLPALGRRRRTVAMDLRGHGDSRALAGLSEYSFDKLVNDLEGLLAHLDIDRCDLLGHSAGGMIAQRFARAHPERLRSLVLMSTAPEMPASIDRTGWLKACEIAQEQGMEVLQEILEKVGRARLEQGGRDLWTERYWLHHQRRITAMTPDSYCGFGHTIFDAAPMTSLLDEIEIPTLVLVGDADDVFLPGADLLAAHLPDVRRVTIPDAGHHPHQENEPAWLDAMEAHLQRVASEPHPSQKKESR